MQSLHIHLPMLQNRFPFSEDRKTASNIRRQYKGAVTAPQTRFPIDPVRGGRSVTGRCPTHEFVTEIGRLYNLFDEGQWYCLVPCAHTVRGTRDGLEHAGMHLDSDITLQCFTYSVGF